MLGSSWNFSRGSFPVNEISSRGTLLVVALFDALPSFLNDFLTGSSGVHFLDPFDCLLQTCPSFCKLRIGLQSGVKCEWFMTERRCSSIMAIHAFQLRWWHCVSHLVGGIVSQSADGWYLEFYRLAADSAMHVILNFKKSVPVHI